MALIEADIPDLPMSKEEIKEVWKDMWSAEQFTRFPGVEVIHEQTEDGEYTIVRDAILNRAA